MVPSGRARLRAAHVYAMLVLSAFAAAGWAADTPPAKAPPTISLIIDYADGAELHFPSVPLKPHMSVLDLLNHAQAHPHGVKFACKGTGERAMVTSIGDVHNQGGGRDKRNWIFFVNDKMADRGFAVWELKPSDVVKWKFTTYSAK